MQKTLRMIGARILSLHETYKNHCSFMFQNPEESGHVNLGAAISAYLYDAKHTQIIRLDMSEFNEEHAITRLIGVPPGFVGFDSQKLTLIDFIRSSPHSVILVENMEKAHPKILDFFLSFMRGEEVADSWCKKVAVSNAVVIINTDLDMPDAVKLCNIEKESMTVDTTAYDENAASLLLLAKKNNGKEVECLIRKPRLMQGIALAMAVKDKGDAIKRNVYLQEDIIVKPIRLKKPQQHTP